MSAIHLPQGRMSERINSEDRTYLFIGGALGLLWVWNYAAPVAARAVQKDL